MVSKVIVLQVSAVDATGTVVVEVVLLLEVMKKALETMKKSNKRDPHMAEIAIGIGTTNNTMVVDRLPVTQVLTAKKELVVLGIRERDVKETEELAVAAVVMIAVVKATEAGEAITRKEKIPTMNNQEDRVVKATAVEIEARNVAISVKGGHRESQEKSVKVKKV